LIIFSAVRSNKTGNLGFLNDKRRMNVSLSRAKFGLIVVGDSAMMMNNPLWKSVVKYTQKLKTFVNGNVYFLLIAS
jgi:regulator of nonsense transcripts 1